MLFLQHVIQELLTQSNQISKEGHMCLDPFSDFGLHVLQLERTLGQFWISLIFNSEKITVCEHIQDIGSYYSTMVEGLNKPRFCHELAGQS